MLTSIIFSSREIEAEIIQSKDQICFNYFLQKKCLVIYDLFCVAEPCL